MPPARIVEDHGFESLVMEYVVQISFKDAKEFYIIVRDRCFQKKVSIHLPVLAFIQLQDRSSFPYRENCPRDASGEI